MNHEITIVVLQIIYLYPQSSKENPQHGQNYDPNTGYESYWMNGSWVYVTVAKDRTDSDYSCGVKCTSIYKFYGKLCTQNRFTNYKTFNSYRHMKSEDCIGYFGEDIACNLVFPREKGVRLCWTVVYKSECYGTYNKKNLTDFLGIKVTPFKYSKYEIEMFNS